MQVGEFAKLVNASKDTIRHYEELKLLKPKWNKHRKDYQEKEVNDFQVIIELKEMGLSLKDIQLLFELKEKVGCGQAELFQGLYKKLIDQLDAVQKEEEILRRRKQALETQAKIIKGYL